MVATRLSLYSGALRVCGERKVALDEDRKPRYLLDDVWDSDVIWGCLEEGDWPHATRTVKIDYSDDIQPDFGYARAFNQPDDFVRLVAISNNEFFTNSLEQYVDENGYWFAHNDYLYVKYVSDDVAYGRDYSLWPKSFEEYVEHEMASQIIYELTQSDTERTRVEKLRDKMLKRALGKSGLKKPPQHPSPGTWQQARLGGGWNTRSRKRG